jgi:UPF0716 family protein affecting phage T7 exclusion
VHPILFGFLVVPFLAIADLACVVRLLGRLGGPPVLAWLSVSLLCGILLLRAREGVATFLLGSRDRLEGGGLPFLGLKAAVVLSGLLLAFPGPLSDLLALALLFGPTRRALFRGILPDGRFLGANRPSSGSPLSREGTKASGESGAPPRSPGGGESGPRVRDAEFEILRDSEPPEKTV